MSGKLTLINDRVNGQGNGDSRNASVDPSAAPDLSDYALGVVVAIPAADLYLRRIATGRGAVRASRSEGDRPDLDFLPVSHPVEHIKWRVSFYSAVAAVVGWPRRLVARARVEARENFELQYLGVSERRDLMAIGVRLPPMGNPAAESSRGFPEL